ncbi:MAG: ABC transporter substrate-binding protein [Rhodospirillales bacterium]
MVTESKNINLVKRQLAEGQIDRREFLRLSTLLGLSATAAYAFAGKVTGQSEARAAEDDIPMGGTLNWGMTVQPIDSPHTFSWVQPTNIVRQVCEYLTYTDPSNVTHPYLLEGWEASDDLKTWDLKVRKGVKWRNGRDFTAEDAAWNLAHVLDPATGSSVVGLMKPYMLKEENGETVLWDANAIEVVDPHTLRLNLKEPQIAIPEHLFHYPLLILDPEEKGVFAVGSNGTGPYELLEHTVGQRAVLRKRSDGGYWGDKKGYLDEVVISDLGNATDAAMAALASGQVDLLYEVDASQVQLLDSMDRVALFESLTAQTGVARTQIDQKPFDDPRVRKAMRLAVDTRELLQIGNLGQGEAAEHHHVAPVHPEYAKLPWMNRDIEAAKKLLAEAGHPDGIDVEIVAKPDPGWELRTVQAMVEQMKPAGIRVNINVMPSAQFWDVWNTVPFGFTSWGHRPLGVMVLGLAYRTGVPWNESHYSDAEFDSLLAQADATLDVDKRREVMAKLETVMQERGPIVQPLWRSTYNAGSDRLRGYQLHPSLYTMVNGLGLTPA